MGCFQSVCVFLFLALTRGSLDIGITQTIANICYIFDSLGVMIDHHWRSFQNTVHVAWYSQLFSLALIFSAIHENSCSTKKMCEILHNILITNMRSFVLAYQLAKAKSKKAKLLHDLMRHYSSPFPVLKCMYQAHFQ